MQTEIRLHGLALCYHCLNELSPSDGAFLRQLPDECPFCGRSLSANLFNIFTLYRIGMEQELNQVAVSYLPKDEKERVEKLGKHYGVGHGWEPYFSFILTAFLSGIIGNFAYDVLKNTVKRMFKRHYKDRISGINVDYHIEIVASFISRYKDKEPDMLLRHWIKQVQLNESQKDLIETPKDEEIRHLLSDIEKGFAEIVLSQSSGQNDSDSSDSAGAKKDENRNPLSDA
ncbi:MAG TPA: hypothetical protein VJ843_00470 [Candidatus Saccharimonadales bacterium]|nr:hypothetical protein [Candidatus Saccharimonadales bacterium]